ncbi:hypothetical protein [Thioclava sp. DLFJ4-1]|uniref:hypothetical protein n=1 Tax=Thioclava sp. DLFJ4-1 TaxID=1915313 RepID=UPI000997EA2E|nr:hypothetical protein [Thioclava sp. DLFJ4-1]OOY15078.1 hypothetical protein BMI85_16150 [Thioclava sp. DLFJ4-1]
MNNEQQNAERKVSVVLAAVPDPWRGVIERLIEERDFLARAGVTELASRNPSVMEYMQHWEGRAEKAEARMYQLRKAGDDLSFAAQTSGGTAGEDQSLKEAISEWEAATKGMIK